MNWDFDTIILKNVFLSKVLRRQLKIPSSLTKGFQGSAEDSGCLPRSKEGQDRLRT